MKNLKITEHAIRENINKRFEQFSCLKSFYSELLQYNKTTK